jgi:hypothetical protein
MEIEELVERAAEPVIREYRLAFRGLADSIWAIPEAEWTRGDRPGDVPVRQAAHLLFACVAYGGGHRLKHGQRFGVPVESFQKIVPAEAMPDRQAVLDWIPEVEGLVVGWVTRCARQALTGTRKAHSPLNVPVYVLRHTVVHLAYLRREMYRRDIPRPRY